MSKAVVLLLLFVTTTVASAEKEIIHFKCNGAPEELSYVHKDHASSLYTGGAPNGAFRVTDNSRYIIYRFELPRIKKARMRLLLANSYKIGISNDGKHFRTVLQSNKTIGRLKNLSKHVISLDSFLKKGSVLYVKSSDWNPKDGFGGCLLSIAILSNDKLLHQPLLHAKRVSGKMTIDGSLNDSDWQEAQWATDFNVFRQLSTLNQATKVAVLYDDEFIYVGFCCEEKDPNVSSFVTQRDGAVYQDTSIELFLAPNVDQPRYYHFVTNLLGTQFDEECGGKNAAGIKWNGKWQAVSQKHDGRYEVEFAIPWDQLGTTPSLGKVIGCSFARTDSASGTMSSWIPEVFHPRNHRGARLVLADNKPLRTFSFVREHLERNPPNFQPRPATQDNSFTQVQGFKLTGYTPSSTPVLQLVYRNARGFPGVFLSDKPLPAGKYLFQLNWKVNGETLYSQQISARLQKEDVSALQVTLRQPFYSSEENLVVEYQKRDPSKRYQWRILNKDGNVVAESNVLLKRGTGEIHIPLSSIPNGHYTFLLTSLGKTRNRTTIKTQFEKGSVLGVPTNYSVSKSGIWLKEGKAFVPIVMFLPVMEHLGELEELGFNTVLSGHDKKPLDPKAIEHNIRILDMAGQNGMGVWLHVCNLFRKGKEDYAGLRNMVSRLKTHPALSGWYIADEPSEYGTPPAVLKKARDIIHRIDPNHPVIGLSVNPAMFGPYAKVVDTFMADPYPIPKSSITWVTSWTQRGVNAVGPNGSFIVTLQAFGKPFFKRGPEPDEIWNMAYQGIAGGSQGLSWWAHGYAREKWDVYEKMVPEVKAIVELTGLSRKYQRFSQDGVYSTVFETTAGRVLVSVNTTKEKKEIVLPTSLNGSVQKMDSSTSTLEQDGDHVNIALPELGFGAWLVK